jgi:cyanophycinase-like exopeptidase
VPGAVALIATGAFSASMAELDRELLASTGSRRPRVAILATAIDGGDAEQVVRTVDVGQQLFTSLGAEVEPVLLQPSATDGDEPLHAVGEADLVYLVDARSGPLCTLLTRTPLGDALREANLRGAVLVGCSGGAGALAARQPALRGRVLPWPLRWRPALGILEDAAVVTGYDRWPEPLVAMLALQAPRGTTLLGIDEEAAVVGREGAWQVHGPARVTVWHGRHRRRYRRGDIFRL